MTRLLSKPWLHRLAMILASLLLFLPHLLLTAVGWFSWELEALEPLRPLSCLLSMLCDRGFPPYFLLQLTALGVGAVVITALAAGDPGEPRLSDLLPKSAWPQSWVPRQATAIVALTAVGVAAMGGAELIQGSTPVWLWALLVAAVGWVWWRSDQARGREGLFSKEDVSWGVGVAALLLGLAAWGAARTLLAVASLAISLVAFLRAWRASGPAGSAFWNLSPRAILVLLSVAGFVVFSYGLQYWRYGFVGDEYAFFSWARDIAQGKFSPDALSLQGIYTKHPVLSSYLQATSMILFGLDAYGWKILNVLLLVGAIFPLYALTRALASQRAALLSAALYLSSHYLISFSKMGYNNAQAVLPLVLPLWLFVLSVRKESLWGFFLAGGVAGLGLYTFSLAAVSLLPLGLLLWLYFPLRARQNLAPWLALGSAWLLVSLPLIWDPAAPEVVWRNTILKSEIATDAGGMAQQFLDNLLYAATATLYSRANTHFVYGAHLDPISAAFLVLGLAALLFRPGPWRARTFVIGGWVLLLAAVGASHQYSYPANTRMFVLVPFYAQIAALGIERYASTVARVFSLRTIGSVLPWMMVGLIFLANLFQGMVVAPTQIPNTAPALILRMTQTPPGNTPVYVIVPPDYNREGPALMLAAHGIQEGQVSLLSPSEAEALVTTGELKPPLTFLVLAYDLPERDAIYQRLLETWPESVPDVVFDEAATPHFYKVFVPSDGGKASWGAWNPV